MKIDRYPGVEPFQEWHKDVFEGRADDIEELYKLLQNEQQVLLYAKSGLGKSSLINAGLQPLLVAQSDTICFNIRFQAYVEDKKKPLSPLDEAQLLTNTIRNELQIPTTSDNIIDRIISNENSLWATFKRIQLQNPDARYILIFDQFEELFSYPEAAIFEFKKQLGDLLYKAIPQ